MALLQDATVASALAISEAYSADSDANHVVAAPPGYRNPGIVWRGEGPAGSPRTFGLGFEREDTLLLAFRGTAEIADLLADVHWREAPFDPAVPATLMGVAGFEQVYHSMRGTVRDIITTVKPKQLHLAGHSLGSALATYLCADLLLDRTATAPSIVLTLWAPPKPGNLPFAEMLREHRDAGQVTAKALVNVHDVVPKYPFTNHYIHPFSPLLLDFGHPFDVLGNHHLTHYLHAYWQGRAHRAGTGGSLSRSVAND